MLLHVRCLAPLLALPLLTGCGAGYLTQAAAGQWSVMKEREPIGELIESPSTDPALKARLETLQEARRYASEQLALPDNDSYTSYADIGRDYVVWNVVATPEFSVAPKQWCFPVAGCVAYRGYFSETRARDYALTLASRGYDVTVGGVAAYSTLGRFSDPVLSSMLAYDDRQLAGILFHELAHQVAYSPDHSAFNEAFAMSVEEEGLARWLAAQGRQQELGQLQLRRAQQAEVAKLFAAHREELRRLYASAVPDAQMRERKHEIFIDLTLGLREFESRTGRRGIYASWVAEGLNNAHLASVATYQDCVPKFAALLVEHDGDLPRYYAAVKSMAADPVRAGAWCAPAKEAVSAAE